MVRTSSSPTHIRVVESSATELRLSEARAFAAQHVGARADVHIVAASRGAADDLARAIARESGATIGLRLWSSSTTLPVQ